MKAPRASEGFAIFYKDDGALGWRHDGLAAVGGTITKARQGVADFDPKLHRIIPVRIVPVPVRRGGGKGGKAK